MVIIWDLVQILSPGNAGNIPALSEMLFKVLSHKPSVSAAAYAEY